MQLQQRQETTHVRRNYFLLIPLSFRISIFTEVILFPHATQWIPLESTVRRLKLNSSTVKRRSWIPIGLLLDCQILALVGLVDFHAASSYSTYIFYHVGTVLYSEVKWSTCCSCTAAMQKEIIENNDPVAFLAPASIHGSGSLGLGSCYKSPLSF